MSHKLDLLLCGKIKNGLETLSNLHQHDPALLCGSWRAIGSLCVGRGALGGAPGPETDTVEGFADVDDDTHDLVVVVVFELLANGGKEDVQPDVVVGLALFEGVGPATTVLVLGVLPLGTHAALEEVIVGLLGELAGRGDVVLKREVRVEIDVSVI